MQWAFQIRQVVGDAHRTAAFRKLHDGKHLLKLLVIESGIRRTEINHALLQLLNSAATPDGLVVDLHTLMGTLESADPPRHRGIDERASSANNRSRVGLGSIGKGGLVVAAQSDRDRQDR